MLTFMKLVIQVVGANAPCLSCPPNLTVIYISSRGHINLLTCCRVWNRSWEASILSASFHLDVIAVTAVWHMAIRQALCWLSSKKLAGLSAAVLPHPSYPGFLSRRTILGGWPSEQIAVRLSIAWIQVNQQKAMAPLCDNGGISRWDG